MAEIAVQQIQEKPSYKFNVVVKTDHGETRHRVSMSRDFYDSLKTTIELWEVIEKSFEFLLQRESNRSILAEFDISSISLYFPEYISELKETLKKGNGNS